MPRADQRLYSALLRMGRRFGRERVPLLGVVDTELLCYNLAWPATVRRQLEAAHPGTGLSEGASLLPRMQLQLETLMQAEEHTRQALAEWADLIDSFSRQHRNSSSSGGGSGSSSHTSPGGGSGSGGSSAGLPVVAAAAAAEEGLALLTRQSQQLADPLLLELEQHNQQQQQQGSGASSSSSGGEPAALSLDDLAAAVRQQHPALFPSAGGGSSGSGSGSGLLLEQVQALSDVVYRQQRFKYEPFEWVYEGLHPLLLPPLLARRKLSPVTLAAVAAGVGRRLGLPLLPIPAEVDEGIAAGAGPGPAAAAVAGQGVPLEQLRPDVAQRYAGRSQVLPAAGAWVVLIGEAQAAAGAGAAAGGATAAAARAGASSAQREEQPPRQEGWQHVLDACTGQVMDAAAAHRKHPTLLLSADWRLHAPLVAWQHMLRTVIQAHQRRGESDLVAHWVYILLALDPQAPEWRHMLQASEL